MERYGRYILLQRVGAGGMAEVFRAATVGTAGFSRQVAVKRILPHMAQEPDSVSMFIDEARIAASLSHPNILSVLDLGKEGDSYFMAMDYVAGAPLSQVIGSALRRGIRIPTDVALHIALLATAGLAHAHQKMDSSGRSMGIVHRDVSPQNIMVGYDGSVRLADFGIAKAANRLTHTTTGNIKGKMGYLAPEQVESLQTDQRADIYAMGVVLYELLAMRRMRIANSEVEALKLTMAGTYDALPTLVPSLPADLVAAVDRALARAVADRFQDATHMLSALDRVAQAQGWSVGAPRVAALMQQLFPDEIEREHQLQRHYAGVVEELARHPDRVPAAASFSSATPPRALAAGPAEPTEPALRSPAGGPAAGRMALLGAAGAVALVGALAGWRMLAVEPAPVTGSLRVDTQPPGARILVDGVAAPSPSPVERVLAPGGAEVEARWPDGRSARTRAEVAAGRSSTVMLVAPEQVPAPPAPAPAVSRVPDPPRPRPRPAEPSAAGEAWLTLQSNPWARVFIDGKDSGRFTPVADMSIPSGKHTITLVNDDENLRAAIPITLRAGERRSITRELR
ncbi:MAG: serine/threonine protein kinase [Deltaproteobacteria bacterium]|nr:serine/threonine protein kinase [Deltaproteobacteria bacterium]